MDKYSQKYARNAAARGSILRPDCAGPRFYTPQKHRDENRIEDQAHDPAHGADSHASWAALRYSDAWVDPT
jgi:hypothetical protein